MSLRAKTGAALASLAVLGLGWGAATASGQTLAINPVYGTSHDPGTDPTSPASTQPTTSPSTTTSDPTTSQTTQPSNGYADGTYTGQQVTHRYGSATVTVTISGGAISDITENIVSDGERKSDQINYRAVPAVRSEAIAANSAEVSTVSGATYTTGAYLTSLQSALDQARQ
ncbi:MAG: FMN-binding protein [Arachnia sp.]